MMQQHQTHGEEPKSPKTPTTTYVRDTEFKSVTIETGEVDKELKDGATGEGAPKKRFLFWFLSKRQWFAALVGSVVLALVVIVLILVFPVARAIFQHNTDKVAISLNYLDITSVPKGSDVSSFGVNLSLRFKHDIQFHAKTKAAKAKLVYGGKTFAIVDLPELDLKSGKQEYDFLITGDAQVPDSAAFDEFASALVTKKALSVDAQAELTAKAFGLTKSGLEFHRTLAVDAINNIAEPPTALNRIIMKSCDASAIRLGINVSITNPAQVGVGGIGALNLTLHYNQDYLGYAVASDGSIGVPRRHTDQLFDVTISNSPAVLPVVGKMVRGIIARKVQFYLTGEGPFATDATLLKNALKSLNVSVLYTDGLEKVTLSPTCASLLTLI